MMKHISVFRLKSEHRNAETVVKIQRQLQELPQKVPFITGCEIGVKPMEMPPESPDGNVQLYDLIQIITFATPEDCAAYPKSQGHQAFLKASSQYMEQVIGIDYQMA